MADIPPANVSAYKGAVQVGCPGMRWTELAGLASVETDHGRQADTGVSSGENEAHAAGPVQFQPRTFSMIQREHPDVGPSRYDLIGETKAAAYYLCENGAGHGDLDRALYAYNHSTKYVQTVEHRADRYYRAAQAAGEEGSDDVR